MNDKLKHDWQLAEITTLFDLPFNDLLFKAQSTHRDNFIANEVQVSTLLNIKTGGCAENCRYCSQSAHYDSGLKASKLMQSAEVMKAAKAAKVNGATRFCMGAAWSNPKDKDIPVIKEMIEGVKDLGLESCMTLGMLSKTQADDLAESGLDYYNHNIDTSREYYDNVITTRKFDDRLDTLEHVRNSGMKTCCGGIIGMGEGRDDRVSMLRTLATLEEHPQSVPINMLVPIKGTPLGDVEQVDNFEFIRTIAVARILMPKSYVRLSAGRESMNDEMQALCFFAGANSVFYGEKLLTTSNPSEHDDAALFNRLGMKIAV